MSQDPAAFREADVSAVYSSPSCFQTALNGSPALPLDAHHILGRGGSDEQQRKMMSSIFNLAWLIRPIHQGPLRDAEDQRAVYLRLAKQNVYEAVGRGWYSLNDGDSEFLKYVERRLSE